MRIVVIFHSFCILLCLMASQDFFLKYPWLNNARFKRILSAHGEKEIIIDRFNIEPALCNGENYSSYMIRATVYYSDGNATHTKQFIIKATLGEQLVRSRNVFAKEICIYESIVPHIENALNTAHIPNKLTPKCFGGDIQHSYLILEDLTVSKYENVDRLQGLNYDQLKISLKTIALWHAASVKTMNNTLGSNELFLKPHVSRDGSPHYRTLFVHAISGCIHAFESNSDYSEILSKLNQLIERVFVKSCAAAERNENGLNVLTHGDLWSNNIMFYTGQNHEKLPLILDFQMSYIGSPILDVSYLMFSSSNENITTDEFDQLFDFYSDALIDTMLKLNLPSSKVPSKQQLQQEFELRGCYGAFFSLFSVPLRILENTNNDAVKLFLNKSQEGIEFRTQIYSNPKARILLSNLLTYFNKKPFLN